MKTFILMVLGVLAISMFGALRYFAFVEDNFKAKPLGPTHVADIELSESEYPVFFAALDEAMLPFGLKRRDVTQNAISTQETYSPISQDGPNANYVIWVMQAVRDHKFVMSLYVNFLNDADVRAEFDSKLRSTIAPYGGVLPEQ